MLGILQVNRMEKSMKVAVIVVEFNGAEETVQYVNKIAQYQSIQKIVVVDNQSTDLNTMQILERIQNEKIVMIQSDKNGGYNYGNNYGIQYLEKSGEKYDYIIISNPDIVIEEKAIKRCLEILQTHKNVAVVAPRMLDVKHCPMRRSSWKMRTFWLDVIHSTRLLEMIFYTQLRKGEYSEEDYSHDLLEVETISGAFFIIKYDVYKEIGKFDENIFLFYEEDILAKKLKEKGYQTISVNDVNFIHYESQTIGKTLSYYKKVKQLYKSKMYYQKQYNHIHFWQIVLFEILNVARKIELIIEVPIRKIWKK